MFTSHFDLYKTQQQELQRQAAEYRLARSLRGAPTLAARLSLALGQYLIAGGEELRKGSQLAR